MWQRRVNVREFIQRNYTLRRGQPVPAGPDRAQRATSGSNCCRSWRKSARRRDRRVAGAIRHPRARSSTSTRIARSSSVCRPSAAQARNHAAWRVARGRVQSQGRMATSRPGARRDLHELPEDTQRGRLRCLHARHPQGALIARGHRPAGCLRARPHHRRLPPHRVAWRGLSDCRQTARATRTRRQALDRGDHPPPWRNWPSRSGR